MFETISPQELQSLLLASEQDCHLNSFIDVRSPKEFSDGSLPYFNNLSILDNQNRAEVGICYKRKGKDAAIALGHKLVAPQKDEIITSWLDGISSCNAKKAIVNCWRGGLRSNIACDWLRSSGAEAFALEGGYKAMRKLLLANIDSEKSFISLSGYTGSGKTKLINQFNENMIDLEGHANHRGSAFGLALGDVQPTQQNFENRLGLSFAKLENKKIIVEAESKMIGKCYLGNSLYAQVTSAPLVLLRVPFIERVQNIIEEYVLDPLSKGFDFICVKEHLLKSLTRIKKTLGGLVYEKIYSQMNLFSEDCFFKRESHERWVTTLLENYYDKTYEYSFKKQDKNTIFAGSYNECCEFLKERVK